MKWNNSTSRNETFQILTTRLKEIDRTDVAERLSTTIFHEKSKALTDDFAELAKEKVDEIEYNEQQVREKAEQLEYSVPPQDNAASHFVVFFSVIGCVSGVILMTLLVNKFMFPLGDACKSFQQNGCNSGAIKSESNIESKADHESNIYTPITESKSEMNMDTYTYYFKHVHNLETVPA